MAAPRSAKAAGDCARAGQGLCAVGRAEEGETMNDAITVQGVYTLPLPDVTLAPDQIAEFRRQYGIGEVTVCDIDFELDAADIDRWLRSLGNVDGDEAP